MANVPDTEPRTPSVNRRHLAYQLVDDPESAVTMALCGNRWDSSHTMRMGLAGLADSMLWRSSVSHQSETLFSTVVRHERSCFSFSNGISVSRADAASATMFSSVG